MAIPHDNPAELEARLLRAIEALRIIDSCVRAIPDAELSPESELRVRRGVDQLIAAYSGDVADEVTS